MSGKTTVALDATPNTSGSYDIGLGTYFAPTSTTDFGGITSTVGNPVEVEFATFDTSSIDPATLAAIKDGQLAITLNFTTATSDAIPHTIDVLGFHLSSDQQSIIEAEQTNKPQANFINNDLTGIGSSNEQGASDYGGITVAAAVPPFSSGTNQNTAQTLDVTQAFLAAAQAHADFVVSFRENNGGISNVTGISLSGSDSTAIPSTSFVGAETNQLDLGSAPIQPFVTLAVNGGSNGTVSTDSGNDGTTIVTTSQLENNSSLVITVNQPANGTLSGAGLSGSSGSYTLAAATPAFLTALLEQLVFTPSKTGPLQSSITTSFTITDLSIPSGGFGALSLGSATVSVIQPAPPVIKLAAAVVVRNQAPVQVFANNGVSDTGGPTDSAVITDASAGYDGRLNGAGLVETVPGAYTLAAAAPATLSAELAALVFTPQPGLAPPLTAVKDSFLVTVTDAASELSNSATVDYSFAAQQSTPVVARDAAVSTDFAGEASFALFSGVSVTDPTFGGVEALTLTLSPASGSLTGQSLGEGSPGVYSLSGSVAQVNAALAVARFTPAPGQAGSLTVQVADAASYAGDISAPLTTAISYTVSYSRLPITLTQSSSSETVTAGSDDPAVSSSLPFAGVSFTDPNPDQLETIVLSQSGAKQGQFVDPSLVNLSPSAVAGALAATGFEFGTDQSEAVTLTATITDTAGETASITNTDQLDFLVLPPETISVVSATLTSPAETSATAAQTITGAVSVLTVADTGDLSGQAPVAGATVTLTDNGTTIGTATTGTNGSFSAAVTLPFAGANSIVATVSSAIGNATAAALTDTLLPPPPITIGTGDSTLALIVDESGAPAGAQFSIAVDGVQVGGVQTVTANGLAGQEQQFDVLGNYAPGANTVTVDELNAGDGRLTVEGAAINGVAIAGSAATLSNNGGQSFAFTATGSQTPVVLGSGNQKLAITLSERGQPGGAGFTLDVDGFAVGGGVVTADSTQGQTQEYDVLGNFGTSGTDVLTVNYLNADNSLLQVDNVALDGANLSNSALTLSNSGSESVTFEPLGSTPVIIGSGTDTLALTVSEQGAAGGLNFAVDVDGTQVGGIQTATASTAAGGQTFDVLGNFTPGTNEVQIKDLDANDATLFVSSAAVNGVAVATGTSALTLSNIGAAGFSFQGPSAVPAGATVIGTGADTLALTTSERGQPAGAQFTVSVDGTQIDGVQTTTANTLLGQTQVLDVMSTFFPGTTNTVTIHYLNASNSLLLIDSTTLNQAHINGGSLVLSNVGSSSFTFLMTTPSPTGLTPNVQTPGV